MEKTKQPLHRRALLAGGVAAMLLLCWLGRDSLWQVAQAASSEMTRLAAECRRA